MGKNLKREDESKDNRRMDVCRREAKDRRQQEVPVAVDRRSKVQRRRQIDPTTCERDYSLEEIEFMQAMDHYKRTSGRMFPTCSEILEVIRKMGYVRVTNSTPAPIELPADVASLTTVPTV